jgi:DNA-3-methyladenine glycosylase II
MKKWTTDDAYKILNKDPIMKKIIKATGKLEHGKQTDVYFSMLRSITSQQLSVKAAETIFNRFLDLFPGRDPLPAKVIKIDIEKLRASGLSYSKGQYLKNIAEFSKTHGLEYRILNKLNDEDLIDYLVQIKGVGRWTAEMILMFTMNRPDVLPVDDLGIKNAMIHHYKLDGSGKKLISQMIEVAEQWKPYRTLASRHLWRYKDEV